MTFRINFFAELATGCENARTPWAVIGEESAKFFDPSCVRLQIPGSQQDGNYCETVVDRPPGLNLHDNSPSLLAIVHGDEPGASTRSDARLSNSFANFPAYL
jgi:hypothetical protein